MPRTHIVLIPGFGGFDALGGVEYYAGTTRLFETWNKHRAASLHYFDNFPTAAVVTRAARLRAYLAKRILRGEMPDDIVLVGHSTGGLDIRQLIQDLDNPEIAPLPIDGGHSLESDLIRKKIKAVVFLSVPHRGTNIADWVRSHRVLRKAVVLGMRAAVAGSQLLVLDALEQHCAGAASWLTRAQIMLACQDALTEANEHYGRRGPIRTAEAHEAASDLALYLRHIGSDFHVIDDLTARCPEDGPLSPAHFNDAERRAELRLWRDPPIQTLSFATLGSRPFLFPRGSPAPVWDLTNPCSYPELSKDSQSSAGTDLSYRTCYRACAGGPFRRPADGGKISRPLHGRRVPELEDWDNDGIVNTASMLWPQGENVLVNASHLDIVGHYKLRDAPKDSARRHISYRVMKSTPQFEGEVFREIWTEIFDFSAAAASRSRLTAVRSVSAR
jgi:hypothetical protein